MTTSSENLTFTRRLPNPFWKFVVVEVLYLNSWEEQTISRSATTGIMHGNLGKKIVVSHLLAGPDSQHICISFNIESRGISSTTGSSTSMWDKDTSCPLASLGHLP